MGFREGEDWSESDKRPIVTGTISPVLGGTPSVGVASQLVNVANANTSPQEVIDISNTGVQPGEMIVDSNQDVTWNAAVDALAVANILNITPSFGIGAPSFLFGNLFTASGAFITSYEGALTGQVFASGGTPSLGSLQTGVASQAFGTIPSATDMAGRVNITTTASAPGAGGTVAIVDFGLTYAASPHAVIIEAAQTYGTYFVTNISSTGFTINTGTGLSNSTTYGIYFMVVF